MLWPQTGAIFASTPRPESAKLFMSWLLSDEYQKIFNGSYVIRKDLAAASPSTSSPWEDQYSGLAQFATFMDNREKVEWWRLQYETSIGTAQGLAPWRASTAVNRLWKWDGISARASVYITSMVSCTDSAILYWACPTC